MRGNGDVSKEKLGKRGQKDGLVVFLAKYLHFLFGLRESKGVSVDPRRLPEDLSGFMIGRPEDEQESLLEGYPMLQPLFPGLDKIGIAHSITGLSAYTPDSLFVLGSVPGVQGFLVATGCCGDRFGPVDPMTEAFQKRCADARSQKMSG